MEEIFYAFCDSIKKGARTATDKTVKKIFNDAGILDKQFDANALDICFRKHLGNKQREVDFNGFNSFIQGAMVDEYCRNHKMPKDQVIEMVKSKISDASPKGHGTTKVSKDGATSRLTNVKGYTGAHKERFDSDTGKGKGIEGREYRPDDKAASGYVSGYKEKDTYDKK